MRKMTLKAAAIAILGMTVAAIAAPAGDIVKDAMTELLIEKNTSSIDTYFADPYIQHNQSVPTGLDGLKALAGQAIAANPTFGYQMVRFLADGDFGIAHGIYQGLGPEPLVAFDVFRVENGKIVEHWDNLAPLAAVNPSGHSQTDGAVALTDLAQTDANKALVSAFVADVLIGGAFDKLPDYFDGNNYIQHNSNIADGLTGLSEGLAALANAGIAMRLAKLHHVFGQGNFVLTLSEGDINDAPTAFYDLFRVEDGKIAEHWDVISPIMQDDSAMNSNGKF